jgi:hypothetical protein
VSLCEGCGQKAKHVALILPFDSGARPLVEHRCETAWCAMGTFREQVRDLRTLAFDLLRYRPETALDISRAEMTAQERLEIEAIGNLEAKE